MQTGFWDVLLPGPDDTQAHQGQVLLTYWPPSHRGRARMKPFGAPFGKDKGIEFKTKTRANPKAQHLQACSHEGGFLLGVAIESSRVMEVLCLSVSLHSFV